MKYLKPLNIIYLQFACNSCAHWFQLICTGGVHQPGRVLLHYSAQTPLKHCAAANWGNLMFIKSSAGPDDSGENQPWKKEVEASCPALHTWGPVFGKKKNSELPCQGTHCHLPVVPSWDTIPVGTASLCSQGSSHSAQSRATLWLHFSCALTNAL